MKRGKLLLIVTVCVVLALAILSVSCRVPEPVVPEPVVPQPVVPPEEEMPEVISWGTHEVGTASHVQGEIVANALRDKYGVNIRIVPVSAEMSKLDACRVGKLDFILAANCRFGPDASQDFANIEWGPQRFRQIWICSRQYGFAMVVHGNSEIKTLADLKGKKIGYRTGWANGNQMTTAYLAYAGLTWDDVERVVFPSFTSMMDGLITGKVDANANDLTTAGIRGFEAMPGGLRVLEVDPKDTEAVERFMNVASICYHVMDEIGAGASKEDPLSVFSFPFPVVNCYESLDENMVYWQTRMIHEAYDDYKDIIPQMAWWEIDTCLATPPFVPFHEGAVRYFKEIGKWTDELEANNNEMIERNLKYEEAWDAAVDEFIAKGLKGGEWVDFWMEKQAQVE